MHLSQNLRRLRSAWLICLVATMATLILAACTGDPSPPMKPVQIKMVEKKGKYSFSPATVTITQGTQVVWADTSDAPHTITSDDGKFMSSNALEPIAQGQNYSFVFNIAGTYSYHCSIHTYMTATITVQ